MNVDLVCQFEIVTGANFLIHTESKTPEPVVSFVDSLDKLSRIPSKPENFFASGFE